MALTIKIPYRAFWWLPVIVVGLLFLLYVTAWLEMWGDPDHRRSVGLSNVKQVGIAMIMYQTDNDGRFPPQMSTMEQLQPVLTQYARSDRNFQTGNDLESVFLGNERLAGRLAESVVDPEHTIAIYDSELWDDSTGRMCGLVNGHVAYVDDQYFKWGLRVELDDSSR